jgi:surface antigen
LRPPAAKSVLRSQYRLVLYRAWACIGLSAIRPARGVLTLILIGFGIGGCSVSRNEEAFARMEPKDRTGSIASAQAGTSVPTESDLAFARNAAADVLTKGTKDSSQPWENPETGARGSVTPLAEAFSGEDGRICRDFLASYVNGRTETWLQGAACQGGHGRWEIQTLRPWRQG